MNTKLIVVVGTLLIFLGTISVEAQRLATFNGGGYYAGGLPGAPIKIEVFSDYECPACRTFYLETINKVLNTYSQQNKVSVVYHDFPLERHKHSREATRYALAARQLGKDQWTALSQALYSEQALWSASGEIDPIVTRTLSRQDYATLKRLLLDPAIDQEIEREIALGRSLKVEATPTFFILAGGRTERVKGGVSYPVLEAYLNRLLQ